MKNKRNDFMYYVKAYKSGNQAVINDLIKYKFVTKRYGKKVWEEKVIDYIDDTRLDNFYRIMRDRYAYTLGDQDVAQMFVKYLIEALEDINLIDPNGREYTYPEVFAYVTKVIEKRLYDEWYEVEGQFRADLDIPDDQLTFDKYGTKHIIHLPEVIGKKSNDPNDEDVTDLRSIDLYSKIQHETFEIPNKIKGFLELVDVKRLLNNDKYYEVYKLLIDDVNAENGVVLDNHTVRHIAEKLGISKTAAQERLRRMKEILTAEYEAYLQYRENRFTGLTRKVIEFIDKYDVLATYLNKMSSNDQEKVKVLWNFAIDWLRNEYQYEMYMKDITSEKEIKKLHKNQPEQIDSIFTLLSDNLRNAESCKKLFRVLGNKEEEIGMRTQQKAGILNQIVTVFRKYLKDAHSSLLNFREYEKYRNQYIS